LNCFRLLPSLFFYLYRYPCNHFKFVY
jgi:hypothetical protein